MQNFYDENDNTRASTPFSSAEAYEWALYNLNPDQDFDQEELKGEAFSNLDALDFTFTQSFKATEEPQSIQETITPAPSSYSISPKAHSSYHHYYYDPQAQDALTFKSLHKLAQWSSKHLHFHKPMVLRSSH